MEWLAKPIANSVIGLLMLRYLFCPLAALLCACPPQDSSDIRQGPPDTDDTAVEEDTGDFPPVQDGPGGFIGSACETDSDCDYDGGVCLTEGYPRGMCSKACDQYCPDSDGHPTTFCVSTNELPSEADALGIGACVSRCDLGIFPSAGCRTDYGCTVESRVNEPSTQTFACMPGETTDLSDCALDLAERGVAFEPTLRSPDHPDGHPELTCTIEDPVWVHSPVQGVELLYYNGDPTERVLASCEMAHALTNTVEDVAKYGATALYHIGTYNCRTISGTSTLSRHSFGDAIDIYGFGFDDGSVYTLIDDWEHDTTTPTTDAARFLYDASYRWYDAWFWNIILTPNYNAGHDNHFHVDLTPESHYIGLTDGRYIGPAPYAD